MPYKLRASDGNLMWDIKDYIVKDNTIELITTMPDKSLDLFDTEFIIVLNAEKSNLLTSFEDDGNYTKVERDNYKSALKLNFETSYKPEKKSKKKYGGETISE